MMQRLSTIVRLSVLHSVVVLLSYSATVWPVIVGISKCKKLIDGGNSAAIILNLWPNDPTFHPPPACTFDSFDQRVRENAKFVAVLCSKAQKTNHFLNRPIFNIFSFYRHSVFFSSNFVLHSSEETAKNII